VLGRFGAEVLPELQEGLKDKEPGVRWTAAMYIGNTGAAGKKAIPTLAELAAKDGDANVRNYAISALGQIGADRIPALVDLLKSKDVGVRQQTMQTLAQFGEKAKPAVPSLIENLKEKEQGLRWSAAYCLAQIGPEAKAALPALQQAAKDKDATVRPHAEDQLRRIQGEVVPPQP